MLRLSIWRPRDILLHFISLLELDEQCNRVKLEISDRLIIDTLAQSARKIIDEEFIQEYQNVFYNLRDVLNQFHVKKLKASSSISDFFENIEKIKFDASFSYDCNDPKNKILILYQMGVIGLCFKKDTIQRRGYSHHYCFNFNEGLSPIYDIIVDRDTIPTDADIVINPLFYKSFSIENNLKEPFGVFDWQYIQSLSIEKHSKRRF